MISQDYSFWMRLSQITDHIGGIDSEIQVVWNLQLHSFDRIAECLLLSGNQKCSWNDYPLKTNISSENWWLEDDFFS